MARQLDEHNEPLLPEERRLAWGSLGFREIVISLLHVLCLKNSLHSHLAMSSKLLTVWNKSLRRYILKAVSGWIK